MKTELNNDVVFTASVDSSISSNVLKVVTPEGSPTVWCNDEHSGLIVAADDFQSTETLHTDLGLEHSIDNHEIAPFESLNDSLLNINYVVKMDPHPEVDVEYLHSDNGSSLNHEDVSLEAGSTMHMGEDLECISEPCTPCKRAKLKAEPSDRNHCIHVDSLNECPAENQFKLFQIECGHESSSELYKAGCSSFLASVSSVNPMSSPITLVTPESNAEKSPSPVVLSPTVSASGSDNAGRMYTLQTPTGQVLYITEKNLQRAGALQANEITPLTTHNNDNIKRGSAKKQTCSKVLKGVSKSTRMDGSARVVAAARKASGCGDENCAVNYAVLSACVGGGDDDDDKDKTSHNMKERKRRARIKDACDLMRQLVPGMSEKTDKATVFEYAARYIYFLKGFVGAVHDKDFLVKYSPY